MAFPFLWCWNKKQVELHFSNYLAELMPSFYRPDALSFFPFRGMPTARLHRFKAMHHEIRTTLRRTTEVRTAEVQKIDFRIDYGQDKLF
jgi:hypothetical protein